jgi:hypothetical protein
LRWTRSFTCKTLDAILFSCWVRLLFRGWMPRGISPLKNADRANFYADAVSSAYVPINSHVCSVNSKLCWRLHRSPNVVTLMLTSNFSVFLEIWVYWQTISPIHRLKGENISFSNFAASHMVSLPCHLYLNFFPVLFYPL